MITSVQLLTLALFLLLPLASARAQDALLEGTGKNAVQTYCVHSGYNAEGWRNNLHMMINVGSTLPQSEVEPLVEYLAKNFSARSRPAAKMISGNAKVSINEWMVPTPGSRPHDPLATADGAIWCTGQFANTLGSCGFIQSGMRGLPEMQEKLLRK